MKAEIFHLYFEESKGCAKNHNDWYGCVWAIEAGWSVAAMMSQILFMVPTGASHH
jgi:hypothetical protein